MRKSGAVLHWRLVGATLSVVLALTLTPAMTASAQGRSAHQAGSAPSVDHIQVDVTSSTSVIVLAAVDPEGLPTTYVVKYGTNGSFGQNTPELAAGSGTTVESVSVPVSGLSPGVTYDAQLEATNAAGSALSAVVTFSTASSGPGSSGPGSSGPGGNTVSPLVSPLPVLGTADTADGLIGVSCWSSGCWAVGVRGASLSSDRPLVERWTGHGFVPGTPPPGAGAALYSVSCPSGVGCVAVGRQAPNVYAAAWVEGRWRQLAVPSPRTPNGDILTSVSCVSLRYCWAVGYTDGMAAGMAALFELWNGRMWHVVGAPTPPTSMLNAVSCLSQSNCWAGGAFDAFPQVGSPLLEHWNGRSWTLANSVFPSLNPGGITAVGCTATSSCWAVEETTRLSRIAHQVNGRWVLVGNDAVIDESGANAVTCASASSCWFVGNGMSTVLWGPSGWTTGQQLFSVGGGLRGVSCLATGECVAVGVAMNVHTDAPSSMRASAYLLRSS